MNVDVSFQDQFFETHTIDANQWESLKQTLCDCSQRTFTINDRVFDKRDVKTVARQGCAVQFYATDEFPGIFTKELKW